MKKTGMDILYGVLVYVGIGAIQILASLPFGDPFSGESPTSGANQNDVYLVAVIPILLWSMIVTWISKIQDKSDAIRKAVIWTAMVASFEAFFGMLNDTLSFTFAMWAFYLCLFAVFLGPLVYDRMTSPK